MHIWYILRLAVKNMWRHWLRTALTMVGIAVAIAAFGLLQTVVDAWLAGVETASSARLITRNKVSLTFPLPVTHIESLRRIKGVQSVSWANWFGGIYIDERRFFPQFAVDARSYFHVYPEYEVPEHERAEFLRDQRGVVVGRKVASDYGWRVGDQVALKGTIYPGAWSFTVRGIYHGADSKVDETQFLFHWDYLNEMVKSLLPSRADKVGAIIVYLENPAMAASVATEIDETFRNSLAETLTETQKSFQLGFVAMVDTILTTIQVVSFAVILIIMAVMANTMVMTARERSREYATLKALGFHDRSVFGLILAESLLIAGVGGAIGVAWCFPLAQLFHEASGRMFLVFEISSTTVVLQLAGAALVGVVAALYPAWASSRIRVVDGLRAVT